MSIEGQGHFFTIYFPGFVCFVLYLAKISGERLQDHWSSGLKNGVRRLDVLRSTWLGWGYSGGERENILYLCVFTVWNEKSQT